MNATIEQHNERPAAVWSAGGPRYDAISRGISDSIEHCVARLNPRPGQRILDLATGTGWTSRVLARRGATVVGCDIARDLLAAARENARAEGLAIEYQIGDAENLPFEDGSFDAVVSTCGVMFASRPEAAAKEMSRVCRKNGRLAITTWVSDGNLSRMFQIMKSHMPTSAIAAPLPPSPFEWGNPNRVRALLGTQFELLFERGVSYYREPSAEAAWDTFSSGYGPTKSLVATLDPAGREALRAEFVAFHAGFPTALGICVPREYWLTVGTRT
jgi:SAM-dependent methyltransferase